MCSLDELLDLISLQQSTPSASECSAISSTTDLPLQIISEIQHENTFPRIDIMEGIMAGPLNNIPLKWTINDFATLGRVVTLNLATFSLLISFWD